MNRNALRITKHILLDILRSRILIAFTAALLAVSFGIFSLESSLEKALFGLTNLVLFLIPLFTLLFTSVYVYNNAEFIQLMLAQPVRRSQLFAGLYAGIALALAGATGLSLMLPMLVYGVPPSGWLMTAIAGLLLLVCVSLAAAVSITLRDKARGLGSVLLLWLVLTILYDGIMLLVVLLYADYPLETATIVLTTLNPVDLARILLIMQFDQSAMLGFTGVFFTEYFGSGTGFFVGVASLLLWIAAPAAFALRRFNRTDW